MLRLFTTTWKVLSRSKTNMFWILAFPIILCTFFHIAFSNLGESEIRKTIPVAVVLYDDTYGTILKTTTDILSEGDDPFLQVTYCTKDEALALLKAKEVSGMIESGKQAKLTVSANMSTDTLNQSILETFVDAFNMQSGVMIQVAKDHPEKMMDLVKAMENEVNYNHQIIVAKNPNVDTYTQYFYNQIAMACLYAAMAGIIIACDNQANLTTLAARKSVSSTPKYKFILAELISATIFEFVMNLVGFLFSAYVLKTGVDAELPLALLTLFVGVLTGVTFGYFIGCFGKMDKEAKTGLSFAFTMPMCFLSGLMVGNMRSIIDAFCPIINHINPAALITDCFYCLSIFDNYKRFTTDLVTLLILSCIFTCIGILATRRTRYASI